MALDDCEIVRAYDRHYFEAKHGIKWETYGGSKEEIVQFTTTVMQKKPTIVFIDYYLEVEGQKYTTGDHIARELVKLGYTGRIILRSANLIQSEFDFIDKATLKIYTILLHRTFFQS